MYQRHARQAARNVTRPALGSLQWRQLGEGRLAVNPKDALHSTPGKNTWHGPGRQVSARADSSANMACEGGSRLRRGLLCNCMQRLCGATHCPKPRRCMCSAIAARS
eukprot:366112-Chlamydomonas_euryale.AAC.20